MWHELLWNKWGNWGIEESVTRPESLNQHVADPYLIILITTKKFICTGAPSPGQLKAWPITATAGGVQAQRVTRRSIWGGCQSPGGTGLCLSLRQGRCPGTTAPARARAPFACRPWILTPQDAEPTRTGSEPEPGGEQQTFGLKGPWGFSILKDFSYPFLSVKSICRVPGRRCQPVSQCEPPFSSTTMSSRRKTPSPPTPSSRRPRKKEQRQVDEPRMAIWRPQWLSG